MDNGDGLQRIYLPKTAELELLYRPDKLEGITEIRTKGYRLKAPDDGAELYTFDENLEYEPIDLTFIPYYAWANRGENEMTVWVHEM